MKPDGNFNKLNDRTLDGHIVTNGLIITEEDVYNELFDTSQGLYMLHPVTNAADRSSVGNCKCPEGLSARSSY